MMAVVEIGSPLRCQSLINQVGNGGQDQAETDPKDDRNNDVTRPVRSAINPGIGNDPGGNNVKGSQPSEIENGQGRNDCIVQGVPGWERPPDDDRALGWFGERDLNRPP